MSDDSKAGGQDQRMLEFTRVAPEAGVWRSVAHKGTRLRFARGTQVLHGGDFGEYMYYLEEGEIRLMRVSIDGREKLLMSMGAGCLVGETPFFDEVPSSSSMVAATDCVVYAFSRNVVLRELLPTHPELVAALLQSLASKVRVLCNQSVSLSLEDLPSRVCKFLHLRMRETTAGQANPRVCPSLNQQELANLLGVHRVTLNKCLRDLEKMAILGPYSRDEVYVLDMERFDGLVQQYT